jgi:hypothetical protein
VRQEDANINTEEENLETKLINNIRDTSSPIDGSILIINDSECEGIDIQSIKETLEFENPSCTVWLVDQFDFDKDIDLIIGIICKESSFEENKLQYGKIAGRFTDLEKKLCFLHNQTIKFKMQKKDEIPHWMLYPYYVELEIKKAIVILRNKQKRIKS